MNLIEKIFSNLFFINLIVPIVVSAITARITFPVKLICTYNEFTIIYDLQEVTSGYIKGKEYRN